MQAQVKNLAENQFYRKIMLQSDWRGEFRRFTEVIRKSRILFRHSCPHTSVQNGKVDRKHRHIVELGLTLLAQSQNATTLLVGSFPNISISHGQAVNTCPSGKIIFLSNLTKNHTI